MINSLFDYCVNLKSMLFTYIFTQLFNQLISHSSQIPFLDSCPPVIVIILKGQLDLSYVPHPHHTRCTHHTDYTIILSADLLLLKETLGVDAVVVHH